MLRVLYLPLVPAEHSLDCGRGFDDALEVAAAEMTDHIDHTRKAFDLLR